MKSLARVCGLALIPGLAALNPSVFCDWEAKDLVVELTNAKAIKTIEVLDHYADDQDLGQLSLGYIGKADSGIVVKRPDSGSVVYFPMDRLKGSDSFTYEICNTAGQCREASVTVVVKGHAAPEKPPRSAAVERSLERKAQVSEDSKKDLMAPPVETEESLEVQDAWREPSPLSSSREKDVPSAREKSMDEMVQYAQELEAQIEQKRLRPVSKPTLSRQRAEIPKRVEVEKPSVKEEGLKPINVPRVPETSKKGFSQPERVTDAQKIQSEVKKPSPAVEPTKSLSKAPLRVKEYGAKVLEDEGLTQAETPQQESGERTLEKVKKELGVNARKLKNPKISRMEEDKLWARRKELKAELKRLK